MSDRVDLQEFVGAFVAEAEELVASATSLLLEIETANAADASRPRAVRDLFRALHTLKGLAGMIGVEPIVEIAHGLESLVRTADRAGGALRRAAVDVCLHGVAAIGERVRAVAETRLPAGVPPELLEAIAAALAGDDRAPPPPAPIIAAWDAKLGAGERQQLGAALQGGGHAWTVAFAPSAELAGRGVTIATVRAALGALGDILKVVPRATPGPPAGLAFDILLVSDAAVAAIAEAAATRLEHVVEVRLPGAVVLPAPSDAGFVEALLADIPAPEDDAPVTLGRSLVRVELGRLDDLQEQLSLMIVSRFRLDREIAAHAAAGHDVRKLREITALQGRQLRDLRRAILRARMVRVAEVLEPLPLLVRSLARAAQKEVRLELDARDAELDKAVADRLLPALVHLVRNAVDHAIELPEERIARGKPRIGTVRVRCAAIGGTHVELAVEDDGRGIDREAIARRAGRPIEDDRDLLAALARPGFSTRDVATRTSGRGLGMDIVKRIAVEILGGELTLVTTPGAGTVFTLRVPLTISVVEVFAFECGAQAFVVPVAAVDEIIELPADLATEPPRRRGERVPVRMLDRRGHAVPLLSLGTVLAIDSGDGARKAIVTRRAGEPVAFAVDRMLGRHEVVVRPVDDPLVRVPGISGATDLGTGRPTLVLDLGALDLGGRSAHASSSVEAPAAEPTGRAVGRERPN